MAKKYDPEYNKKILIEAMERSLGIVTAACKECQISRDRFYHYYNTDDDFKKAINDIYDIQTDFVENQLFKKIKEGSERSILFYMRYKGKKRGYTDSLDITTGGDKINTIKLIKVNRDDLEKDDENESE